MEIPAFIVWLGALGLVLLILGMGIMMAKAAMDDMGEWGCVVSAGLIVISLAVGLLVGYGLIYVAAGDSLPGATRSAPVVKPQIPAS